MPTTRLKNNARSTLFSGISNVATSMTVQPGHGDRFPVADASNIFYLTLEDSSKNYEIVKVTARASGSDSMTIVRAQDSSTARAFIAGVIVGLRATAGLLELALNAQANLDAHAAASDPHPQYATDADLSAHAVAADPHPQYLTPAEATAAYSPLAHAHAMADLDNAVKAYDIAFNAGFTSSFAAQNLAVQTYNEVIVPRAMTIEGVSGFLETVATGAAVIVDILVNGVTVFAVTKPQFADSASALTAGALTTTAVAAGDRITFKVTQIGSTIPGARMRLTLKGRLA